MPAAYSNLFAEQGSTFTITITVDDAYNQNYDLTGYTANIAPGRYVYDTIIRESANNTTTRILEGIFEVSPAVTR